MNHQPALVALMVTVAVAGTPSASRQDAGDFARALQKKYGTVRDFSAEFVHTYEGGVLKQKATERGTVLIKKPGKMRWTYTHPEEKLFVSDGVKLYSYIKADRQVTVSALPREDQATTAILFLAGKGDLARDFAVDYTQVPGAPPDTVGLKLVPKTRQAEYESLLLAVDRDTLRLRTLVTVDQQGGTSTFNFANLKENVGIPDKSFAFTPPRGVDVIGSSHAP
jgi:outer membrane lipoprotein carrier protein